MASMTKPFVGTAVMMLVEEGQVDLDQRVSDILPSFERPDVQAITVRQLLTHTAGWANEGAFPSDFIRTMPDLLTLVDSIVAQGPPYAPGQAYRYGDAHSWILGAIVEAVSGVSSDRFIEERILGRLNLSDTRPGFSREPGGAERRPPQSREFTSALVRVVIPA
jgi:CubicO group peptidase (beta-lactamase class C family)